MRLTIAAILGLGLWVGLSTCGNERGQASGEPPDGEALARIHCGGCHAFPEPARLPKATWREGVLPHMALRLGRRDSIEVRLSMEEALEYRRTGAHPDRPLIDSARWRRIVDYYVGEAPDSLPPPAALPVATGRVDRFSRRTLDLGFDGRPLTTLVHWSERDQALYVGEGSNHLLRFDGEGRVRDIFDTGSPPVALAEDGQGGLFVLGIGYVRPNNEPRGELRYLDARGRLVPVLRQLPRPVDLAVGDLDADGIEDLVIAGYGHLTGRLAWWKGQGGLRFEERVLLDQPGALSTYIRDLDGDGRDDILTLMAQGDERVVVHYNEGGGRFRPETILRFDPVQGSSHMRPADLDGDGDLDLIITNGDNADYSMVRKPYHGLRIYENDGTQRFREAFFLPLPGATKAVPFRLPGDAATDLAVIAFFPDFGQEPLRSVVTLERQAAAEGWAFETSILPDAGAGRWLTLDAGDLDRDGQDDLVLGSFTYSPTPTPREYLRRWFSSREDVLVLYQ